MIDQIKEWADTCDVTMFSSTDKRVTIASCRGRKKPELGNKAEWVFDDAAIGVEKSDDGGYAVAVWREAGEWRVFYLEYSKL